jgi:probable HAF family extracellular repeat protein
VVNNSGMAAGVVDGQAAVWRDGQLIRLAVSGRATAINESGVVVGWMRMGTDANAPQHAFMWKDGVLVDLHPASARSSVASSVNESGQVAGTVDDGVGTVWENGVPRSLGVVVAFNCFINDLGVVVGNAVYGNENSYRTFIYNGTVGPIPGTGTRERVRGLNNAGLVLLDGEDTWATFAQDGQEVRLNDAASIRGAGWRNLEPHAMNDSGAVVGIGNHDGSRAFLLVPQDAANPALRGITLHRHVNTRTP